MPWGGRLTVAIVLATMIVTGRARFHELTALLPIEEAAVRQFVVLVQEDGKPKLENLGAKVRVSRATPILLPFNQIPLLSDLELRAAAALLEREVFSLEATANDKTVTLRVNNDDFTYWSRYRVDEVRIIPVAEGDMSKRDAWLAFLHALKMGLWALAACGVAFFAYRRFR